MSILPDDPRSILVEVCHLMAAHEFTSATGGNVSVKVPDGSIWITPSCLHKRRVQIEDLVKVSSDGEILVGQRTPSSETIVHLAVYQALPGVGAVIHAHPPAATGFAQACREIDTRSSSEAYFILGPTVPLIPYARPSTPELADIVRRAMNTRNRAYLLANHGILTWGADLWEAYDILDTLEMFAQSQVVANSLGGLVPLPEEECRWLEEKARSV